MTSTAPASAAANGVDVHALLGDAAARLDRAFADLPARFTNAPPRLVEAMRYSLTAGGKRLRPALVLETARACGAPCDEADARFRSALSAAVAIELIHTFSLVHDDLPAMDDDDLRRGRPTNHKVFGEAMAILAGDAMTAVAFEVIATDAAPAAAAALVRELARATGPAGMIGGQVLDIDGENRPVPLDELKRIHAMKTGALLTAACRLGAIAAAADERTLSAVTTFARHMGLAFQIVDDVLDVTSTPEQMGKAVGKDKGKGKNTYPGLLGLDEAKRQARQQLDAALEALRPVGPSANGLRAIAQFVVERNV